jgi:hypothetical protein
MVARVPMTPILPERVARAAAWAPASTTPITGSEVARRSASTATADEELHATTNILIRWWDKKRSASSESRMTAEGDLLP